MAPKYVKAPDPDSLVIAMIRNNLKNSIEYKYYDIGLQGSEWFAWYLADVSNLIKIRTSDA